MLPRVESFRDIPNVEELCRGVLAAARRAGRLPRDLSDADFDEALAFLLGELYVIAATYDPSRQLASSPNRQPTFRHYAFAKLTFRLIDWSRSFFGRQGQHRPLADTGAAGEARLDGAVAEGPGDRIDDWALARARDPLGRDRARAELLAGRGLSVEGRAPRRDRGAAPVAA